MDTTGVCLYINRAGARMLGYEPAEVLGLHAHQLFHHSHADGSPYPAEDCPVYRGFLSGKGCRVEDGVFWQQDGVPVPVEYSSFPLLERDNEIQGAVVIFVDISERKKAGAEIRAAYQATEAATRAKSTFLSNMSHELRTPLNAVIGYAELAEEKAAEEGAPDLVSDLGKIRVAGHHLLTLINQVLDLSKVEAGRMEIEVSEFTLAGLAADVITTVKPMADQRGDRLEVSVIDHSGLCRGDVGKLTQTLLNVVSNAIKFTSTGLIEVSLRLPSDGWLEIKVTDSGIGMTRKQLRRVFEPFSQADPSTTRRYGGTGLGLAICRSFCRLMGGDIDATSVLGAGSRFVIRVPVEVVETPVPSPGRTDSEETPEEFTANTVLVIDDDTDARELMVRNVEPAGYKVHTADGMAAGMALGARAAPDRHPGRSSDAKGQRLGCTEPFEGGLETDDHPGRGRLGRQPALTAKITRRRRARHQARRLEKTPEDRRSLPTRCQTGELADGQAEAAMSEVRPKFTILIVEDNPENWDMLSQRLRRRGYQTLLAADGLLAVDSAAAIRPDLILMDMNVPGIDGWEATRRIKADSSLRTIPVIALTAHAMVGDREKALAAGCNDYHTKPIDLARLLTRWRICCFRN